MNTVTFDKLLLKTAFCCMASDGHIDNREVAVIKEMCKNSPLFETFNFEEEINLLVSKINSQGKEFIQYFFDLLSNTNLSEQEALTLIDFAVKTIKADEQIEYSEIKFFKNIRHRLKISDEAILKAYPGLEFFLEEDITSESHLGNITNQYLETAQFPKFASINIEGLNITETDSPATSH